ncbi:WG repeat-containing protein [Streptomyces sp. NPDC048723]|uniref:WG repeat-containing protein n=1 Tax=Streptomyces sp. NPDC048723 TaxID=3365589 RepID=UPI003719F72B
MRGWPNRRCPTPRRFEDNGLSRFQAEDGRWGYARTGGTPVIPATLTEAHVFRHGLAAARTEDGMGYIDATGRFVIRPQHAAAGRFAPNGLVGVRMADNGRCDRLQVAGAGAQSPVGISARFLLTGSMQRPARRAASCFHLAVGRMAQ